MSEDPVIGGNEQFKRLEFKRLGFTLLLGISPDGLSCSCSYLPAAAGAPLTLQELRSFLTESRIVEGILDDGIAALLNSATSLFPATNLLLASGTPMIPGEDGKIELIVKDSLDAPEPEAENENIIVDFRNVQEFLNVKAGDLIGRVLPPTEGVKGRSIFGRDIPPTPGNVLKLELGPNVRLGEDGSSLFSESDGRVFSNGAEISVEDVYKVKGDVDFKVGNILFNGFVEVTGDVLDGFEINATKGVKVQGNIGVCRIETDGDISFCGMSGQGKGRVRCGGNLAANFLNDIILEAAGNIVVDSEIRNCLIKSLGTVTVNKGVLSGGECVALAGIETASLGTVTSLHTHVLAGVNHKDMEEHNKLFHELKQLIADFNAKKTGLDPKEFMKARLAITDRLQEVRARQHPACNPKVNVKKVLYEGVTITLGEHSEEIREEKKGPMSIIENTMDGGFRYLGMTDLSVRAQDIEQAFVQQRQFDLKRNQMGGE
jgi:uncharacterized protein (DUF342 family)